jgi:hypothetical protein
MLGEGSSDLESALDQETISTEADNALPDSEVPDFKGDFQVSSATSNLSAETTALLHHTEDGEAFQPKLAENPPREAQQTETKEILEFRDRLCTMKDRSQLFGYRMEEIESLLINLIGKNVRQQYIRHWTKECNDLFRLQVILRKRSVIIKEKIGSS